MNGLGKHFLVIGAASMVVVSLARAETSVPAPTASPAPLTQQEQGYMDMGQAQAAQQVQTINRNSTPPPVQYQAPTGGSASSAKKSSTMQLVAAGASVAAAGFLATKCANVATASWGCPMTILAMAQVAQSLASSGNASRSANEFSTSSGSGTYNPNDPTSGGAGANNLTGTMGTNNGTGSDGTTGNTNDPAQMAINSEMGKIIGEYNSLRSTLEKSGYKVSADGQTITDPSGKQIPASAFSNPNATASAFGLDGAQSAELNDAMKTMAARANDRAKGIAMAIEGGAGGAGVANATGGGGSGRGGSYGGYNFRMPRQAGAGGAKGVSGLSKQLGNDKIGLAGDDIFEMIHIRYQERDKNGNFQKQ